jgi:hypothetical protein
MISCFIFTFPLSLILITATCILSKFNLSLLFIPCGKLLFKYLIFASIADFAAIFSTMAVVSYTMMSAIPVDILCTFVLLCNTVLLSGTLITSIMKPCYTCLF